jgi:hypothetical protein
VPLVRGAARALGVPRRARREGEDGVRYAETVTEVGVHPLRRRDRASLTLALDVLRGTVVTMEGDAAAVLDHGGPVAAGIACALHRGAREAGWQPAYARLALLLRVLLRVDAGDYGKSRPVPTGISCRRVDHRHDSMGRCRSLPCGCYEWSQSMRPLWERAGKGER